MSLTAFSTEREKYYQLLELTHDQIKALEMDDLFEFDRILKSKDELIKSFGDSRGLLDVDPALSTVCAQIQDRDKTAMRLLYDKLGRLKRQIAELNQYRTARTAYKRLGARPGTLAAMLTPETPRFVDTKS